MIERFVYDRDNIVLEFLDSDGSGSGAATLQQRYLWGPAVDQLLAQEDVTKTLSAADRVLWPLTDNLGTTRDLADQTGAIAEHFTYDAFGKVTSGDTSLTRYLYATGELDPDTGLAYHHHRWYDPALGRWLSEDPLGFAAGDSNLSRYVGNNAANLTDPSGLAPDYRGPFLRSLDGAVRWFVENFGWHIHHKYQQAVREALRAMGIDVDHLDNLCAVHPTFHTRINQIQNDWWRSKGWNGVDNLADWLNSRKDAEQLLRAYKEFADELHEVVKRGALAAGATVGDVTDLARRMGVGKSWKAPSLSSCHWGGRWARRRAVLTWGPVSRRGGGGFFGPRACFW